MWRWRLFAFSLSLCALGCRSVPEVATQPLFSSQAAARRAVLSYRQMPEAAPVHAEALLRYEPPANFQLAAWKGPLPWIDVQMTASGWRIEFPPRHEVFRGRDVSDAPAQLMVWLMIREKLARQPSDTNKLAVTGRDGASLQIQFSPSQKTREGSPEPILQ